MRKLTEPQAHRGRVAVIEGNFPEGMQARCAWCGNVQGVEDGQLISPSLRGGGATRLFKCGKCLEEGAA